ncbi:MAG: sensor histidine kinase, partial [Spirochaetaceae bacterium]
GDSYLPALSLSVFNFELEDARLLLEGMSLSQAVAYVEVEERRGEEYQSILSVGPEIPDDPLQTTMPLEVDYEGTRRRIGRLHLYADMAVLRQRLNHHAWRLVVSSAIQVFAVALVIMLMVQRFLVRHLRKTARFLGSVELPQAESLVLNRREPPRGTADELDEIAGAINNMTARISRTYEELSQTRDQLRASLSQKETLLRELYHRTKNNMQVIISMLSLQAGQTSSIAELVSEAKTRIHAMALVHEKLYRSKDLSRIHMPEYLAELTSYIVDSRTDDGAWIDIEVHADDISLLFDTAIACGLLVNELVTNAIEHAFTGIEESAAASPAERRRKPRITVRLTRGDQAELQLVVSDNGRGIPDGVDPRAKGRMGLESVYAIAEHQLGGVVGYRNEDGLTWYVSFPDSLYRERV